MGGIRESPSLARTKNLSSAVESSAKLVQKGSVWLDEAFLFYLSADGSGKFCRLVVPYRDRYFRLSYLLR
jgi:hypothetical protein